MIKAFSLIELTFVIIILGILLAIAVPRLFFSKDDANLLKIKTDIATIQANILHQKTALLLSAKVQEPVLNSQILTELNLHKWSIDNQNLVFDNVVRFNYDSNATINCLSPQEICDKLKL